LLFADQGSPGWRSGFLEVEVLRPVAILEEAAEAIYAICWLRVFKKIIFSSFSISELDLFYDNQHETPKPRRNRRN
jgi:hypothetical protein